MNDTQKADLCIIGGGSGGLSVAAGAAQLGAKTVLIESGKMGGRLPELWLRPLEKPDRCRQSRPRPFAKSEPFGIKPIEPEVDMEAVRAHIPLGHRERSNHMTASNDLKGLGVQVIQQPGRFPICRQPGSSR